MTCCAGPTRTSAANYIVASNMQDAVLVDLAAKVRPGVDVLFLDTGYHFVETIGTRDAVEAVYDVNVVNVTPENTVAEQDELLRQEPVRPRAQRVLPDAQGRAAGEGAARLLRVGDRHPPGGSAHPRQRAADQLGQGVRAGEDQPARRVDRRRHPGLHRRQRRARQSPCLRRLSVDRMRAVHRQAGRGRRPAQRPLGRACPRRNAGCTPRDRCVV